MQCTMATGLPSGVVTMSISSCTRDSGFSVTTMEKMEVPADMLPVRTFTLLVATMPVPASPSGGHMGTPGCSLPLGSRSFAPSAVRTPAFTPAGSTLGRMSFSFHPYFLSATSSSNREIIRSSKSQIPESMGNMPEASPTPSTRSPPF